MPPFGRLASLLISGTDRAAAESHARGIARTAPPADKIEVLGPAEAPLSVVRGRYRYRILVKAPREADIQAYLRLWMADMPKARGSIRLSIDIDPYNFL
jgi:primosomal protein N' (replication factor Y)